MWKILAWFIPGGPVISALASVIGATLKCVAWFLSKTLDTFTRMLANPATFVVAGVFLLVAFGGGIRLGIKWDAHLVQKAAQFLDERTYERDEARVELLQWKGRYDGETTRADEAAKAGQIAEAKARAALAALARSRGVRDGGSAALAKAGPQKAP